MNKIIEYIINNWKLIIVITTVILIIILLIFFIYVKNEEKWNNQDITSATHGVTINDKVEFYRKPKLSKWRLISNLKLGQNVYIMENFTDEKGIEWYKIKAKDKVGYVEKENVDYFDFSEDEGQVIMSDVSKFNVIYKHFETPGDYGAFLLNTKVNYVYIRAGGRGYGEEGNFYTDPNFQMFIEECEFLGVPYGFYYIDEAITEEELDEEVEFMEKFLQENATKMCKLPLVIDVESHDGVGRADEIWEERAELVTTLISKFKEKDINTIVYSNANTINEYLYTIDTKFWVAYYDLKGIVPKHWYTETDQEAAQNEEFTNKIVGWQFTEKGIGKNTKYPVDLSVVDNNYFKEFVK